MSAGADPRSGLPPFPKPGKARTNAVLKIVRGAGKPVTVSEICSGFREGERLAEAVGAELGALDRLGAIAADPYGWRASEDLPRTRGGSARRFATWSIEALESHFDAHRENPGELELLMVELGHRDSKRALKLRNRVMGAFAIAIADKPESP